MSNADLLAKLAQFDTLTICNIIELFDVRPYTAGYMDGRDPRHSAPEMDPSSGTRPRPPSARPDLRPAALATAAWSSRWSASELSDRPSSSSKTSTIRRGHLRRGHVHT
ncbi:MAG: hypothetical protein R2838_18785 [Caldilineaceae bacterium]